jgi:hypothetical protein
VSVSATVNLGTLPKDAETWARQAHRSIGQGIIYAAILVARSARKLSKPGRKRHEVEKNPEWDRVRRMKPFERIMYARAHANEMLTPYFILHYLQGREPETLGSYEPRTDPRSIVRRRGLAQRVWSVIGGKLGAMTPGGLRPPMKPGQAQVVKRLEARDPWALMRARLSYLTRAYPSIESEAVARGGRALAGAIELNLHKRLRAA